MEKLFEKIGMFVIASLLLFLIAALFAWPVLLLVNYLFTPALLLKVFGVAKITFWQAFALDFLCGTLFKSSTTVKS